MFPDPGANAQEGAVKFTEPGVEDPSDAMENGVQAVIPELSHMGAKGVNDNGPNCDHWKIAATPSGGSAETHKFE